jgi:transmembrane sensor
MRHYLRRGYFIGGTLPRHVSTYNENRELSVISQDPHERRVREAAAEWAILLSEGELDTGRDEALQQWLRADPRHAEALSFAQRTWAALGALPAERKPSVRRAPPTPGAQSVPLAARHKARLRRWGAAACLALLLGGLGLSQSELLLPLQADYRTSLGEVRNVTLADGSEVTLDSASAIRLDYSPEQRRVELLAGRAIFQVAPQAERPFVVATSGATAQALGTRFIVRREDDRQAWIGVLEHAVQVNAAGQERRLEEGDSVRYGAAGITPQQVDLQRATSWQRGLLVFDRVPLAQVVEQLNRYRSGHILIANDELARREVSGVFRLNDLDNALSTLIREMQLQHTQWLSLSLIY